MPDALTTPRKSNRAIGWLLNGLLVAASLAVTLVCGEIAVRIIAPAGTQIAPTSDQYKFYAYEPRLGWVNKVGAEGEFRRAEFSYPVRINQHGMRDAEAPVSPRTDRARVAVLGDSFTWGIGVRDEDRFTEVVERQGAGKYEVLNFGVSGYGPLQYYLQLDQVLRFKPQVVLLTFCLGNDFADNVFWRRYGYYKPYIDTPAAGVLKPKGYPLPHAGEFVSSADAPFGWLMTKSRLAHLIVAGLSRRQIPGVGPGQAGPTGLDETGRDFYFPDQTDQKARARAAAIAVNRQILEAIKARLDAEGIEFAVVIAPTKCEYGLCFGGEGGENWTARRTLATTLDELGIALVDPSAKISAADFWRQDGHWRPSGHAKVAASVGPWLDKAVEGLEFR